MNVDLLEVIKNRRSIRKFKSKPVEKEKLDKLLEAAEWAPSAGNLQARDVILVTEQKTKEELVKAKYGRGVQHFILDAPVVIVVCVNQQKALPHGQRGTSLYCIQDATASIQNILLMAYALGLGSCWIGAFDEDSVREVLGIPKHARPIAIIPLGYPDESPRPTPRKIDLHKEHW